jgi:hypothetical protein
MIAFDLKCSNGHVFEGWFGSSVDYEGQREKGMIACPNCGDSAIGKAIMAPNIVAKSNQKMAAKPITPDAPKAPGTPLLPPQMREMLAAIAEKQAEMLPNSTWVGGAFPEEVRAIYYGEAPERLIHGEATPDQARELAEEGVPIMPMLIPVVPPKAQN